MKGDTACEVLSMRSAIIHHRHDPCYYDSCGALEKTLDEAFGDAESSPRPHINYQGDPEQVNYPF